MSFANWLQQEIDRRGWGQAELARRTGLASGQISRFLNGTRHPGPKPCIAIASALGVAREDVFRARGWLLDESEQEPPIKLSPEVLNVAVEIEQLPLEMRRAALQIAKTTAQTLRDASRVGA